MLLLKAPLARSVWHDVFASVVVFLVALPLSMGIAIASGVPMEKAGTVRDGGSFLERVKNISCWNTLMDEAAYMNKRWNDFKVA